MDAIDHADAVEGSRRERLIVACSGACADANSHADSNANANANSHADADALWGFMLHGVVGIAGLCDDRDEGDV
jgi:hypothetical protein